MLTTPTDPPRSRGRPRNPIPILPTPRESAKEQSNALKILNAIKAIENSGITLAEFFTHFAQNQHKDVKQRRAIVYRNQGAILLHSIIEQPTKEDRVTPILMKWCNKVDTEVNEIVNNRSTWMVLVVGCGVAFGPVASSCLKPPLKNALGA